MSDLAMHFPTGCWQQPDSSYAGQCTCGHTFHAATYAGAKDVWAKHAAPDAAASEAGEVAIWSGEHRAYWRRGSRGEGAGYTLNVEEAGVWSRADAVRLTSHCGPEKLIALHERPTTQGGGEG